jgi:hypothetical protein
VAELTIDVSGLSPWTREQCAAHLDRTYALNYGGLERMTAYYFRVDPGECVTQTPPAVVLRELAAGVRAGGPVRVRLSGMSKTDKVRVSALLEQTAGRPGREGSADLESVLSGWRREWDRQARCDDSQAERDWILAGSPKGEIVY